MNDENDENDEDSDDGKDQFCGRCGQTLPDLFDQQVNEAVIKHRRELTLLAAVKAREHFAIVGRLRGQQGLTHPRVQQLTGDQLEPGWLIRKKYQGAFGETILWDVIVSIEDTRINTLGLDPAHGNIGGSIGKKGQHWIDDLHLDEKRPYDPHGWSPSQEGT